MSVKNGCQRRFKILPISEKEKKQDKNQFIKMPHGPRTAIIGGGERLADRFP